MWRSRSPRRRWPGDAAASLRIFGDALELEGGAGVAIHAPADWEPDGVGGRCGFRARPGMPATVTLTTRRRSPCARRRSRRRSLRGDEDVPSAQRHIRAAEPRRAPGDHGGRAPRPAAPRWRHRRGPNHVTAAVATLRRARGTTGTAGCATRPSPALAMLRLGLVDAARSLGAFIGSVVIESGPVPLVRVDGSAPPDESEIAELAGYRRRAAGPDRQCARRRRRSSTFPAR